MSIPRESKDFRLDDNTTLGQYNEKILGAY